MNRILGYFRRLWQEEEPAYRFIPPPAEDPHEESTYRFVSPPLDQTLIAPLLPYRSPASATFHQYQCNYWEAPYKRNDCLTSWQWFDEYSFSHHNIMRREYPS